MPYKNILLVSFDFNSKSTLQRINSIKKKLDPSECRIELMAYGSKANDIEGETILTIGEAKTNQYDATIVLDWGEIHEGIFNLESLQNDSFGTIVQYILNGPSLYVNNYKLNRLLKPHVLILNCLWKTEEYRMLYGYAFYSITGFVDVELYRPQEPHPIPRKMDSIVLGAINANHLTSIMKVLHDLPDSYQIRVHGFQPVVLDGQMSEWIAQNRIAFDASEKTNLNEFFQTVDVMIFPPSHLAWVSEAAEAMACGVPCILSPFGSYDFARDRVNAIFCPNFESAVLAKVVQSTIQNSTLLKNLSSQSSRMMPDFSIDRYIKQFCEFVKKPTHKHYFRIPNIGLYGKWEPELRMKDFASVFPSIRSASVLDLGAAEGIISYFFATKGNAALIHSFEFEQGRVDFANQNIVPRAKNIVFCQADLSLWQEFEKKYNDLLLPQYDVVAFLGLYHHLPEPSRKVALYKSMERARDWYLIRTPEKYLHSDRLHDEIVANGFQVISQVDADNQKQIGWMGIYRRISGVSNQ